MRTLSRHNIKQAIYATRVVLAFMVLWTASSCVKDDESATSSSSSSRDCYISKVTLGTMRRIIQTTDTTTTVGTYDGSYYAMRIDQIGNVISNPVPLLYNTIMDGVLIDVQASGTVQYRHENQIEESWTNYSSTDSINISSPIRLRVFSGDGSMSREYRMTFNVQPVNPEGFSWSEQSASTLAGSSRAKALWMDGALTVLATDGKTISLHRATVNTDGGMTWAKAEITDPLVSCACVETLVQSQGALWMSTSDSLLLRSDDSGKTWQQVAASPLRLLCASDTVLYALGSHGQMCHAGRDGVWVADMADTQDKLPVDNAVGIVYDIDHETRRAMVLGHRGDEATATVWGRTLHYGFGGDWVYYPWVDGNQYPCPWLEHPSLTLYNKQLVLVGGNVEKVYASMDNGITWKSDYGWTLPDIKATGAVATAITADTSGNLWLMCGERVWRGRPNSLK